MVSTSTLSWLDSSEHERRSVMELVSALNEPGTLDELGIGTIRDTIADTFFPGTSTIQTRARYFLFIPWILQMVEDGSPRGAEDRARRLQMQLRDALVMAHGPNETGVIGVAAGAALQRWPIDIYWLGLARWGIRRHPGSISSYFTSLGRPSPWRLLGRALDEPVEGHRDEAADDIPGNWASIPPPPDSFPEVASFTLSPDEARFLRERVVLTHPDSLLAHILQTGEGADVYSAAYPWDHPPAHTAPASVRKWLHDARLFSLVHQGAVLLYNLMLARKLNNEDIINEFSAGLAMWTEAISSAGSDLERWDRASMWERLLRANPRLRPRTREFVDRWHELASMQTGGSIGNSTEAQRLIREREHALKGGSGPVDICRGARPSPGLSDVSASGVPLDPSSAHHLRHHVRSGARLMLEPGRRRLFLDTLRPPEGYVLDRAVGTTFTLDLMTLLAVPLAFTFSDVQDRDGQIPTEPLSLLESARRYADRIVVFCQGGQTGVPRARQPALAFIEQSVIAAFPPHRGQFRGVFHPKVWVLRYAARGDTTDEPIRYRLVCQSRNLTFDASWDASLVLDGELSQERVRKYPLNGPIAEFMRALPTLAVDPISNSQEASIEILADELLNVRFDPSEGLELSRFLPFGISRRNVAYPDLKHRPLLVVSPFLDGGFLRSVVRRRPRSVLISRREELLTAPAAGVIAQAIDHLRENGVPRIDVIYICSNQAIARQNVDRIRHHLPIDTKPLAERITLLPYRLNTLDQQVNLIALTPGTSFNSASRPQSLK